MEQLCNLLTKNQFASTSLMAQKGTFLTDFGGTTNQGEPWIIGFGASDHMIGCESMFYSYVPSPGNHKIRVADGSYSIVAGIGSIRLSPKIVLKFVLHVPSLSYNLLSVSKITKDLNCVIQFSLSVCVFQDLIFGKKIGSAKEVNGLYYFEKDLSMSGQVHAVVGHPSLSPKQQIMLLHCRLGHQNFLYLKHLFQSLFQNFNESLQCEICQFAKHKHVFLPPQPYRASKPFTLIHSDIWGPSHVKTLTNKKWFISFIDDHTQVC